METVLTYKQKRDALFGLKSRTETVTVSAPVKTFDDYKPYHIYAVGNGTERKVDTAFTQEEAKALIQYEREEDELPAGSSNTPLWSEYSEQFKWVVKDTKKNTSYTYNPATRSLELSVL